MRLLNIEDNMTNVLILCTHNSARSVLAEAMLNHLAARLGKDVHAHSAGSSPSGGVNPFAVEVLQAAGVATSALRSKSWDEFSRKDGPPLSVVITVCDNAAAEPCPVFFGAKGRQPVRVHWSYTDPGHTAGDEATVRRAFELTRQAIAYRMLQLLALPLDDMEPQSIQAALAEIGRS